MIPLDIAAIEQQARQRRAEEMQRIQGLVSIRLRLYGQLMGASLLTGLIVLAEALRPLFSWNPQNGKPAEGPGLLNRLSRAARALFSWNPQAHGS